MTVAERPSSLGRRTSAARRFMRDGCVVVAATLAWHSLRGTDKAADERELGPPAAQLVVVVAASDENPSTAREMPPPRRATEPTAFQAFRAEGRSAQPGSLSSTALNGRRVDCAPRPFPELRATRDDGHDLARGQKCRATRRRQEADGSRHPPTYRTAGPGHPAKDIGDSAPARRPLRRARPSAAANRSSVISGAAFDSAAATRSSVIRGELSAAQPQPAPQSAGAPLRRRRWKPPLRPPMAVRERHIGSFQRSAFNNAFLLEWMERCTLLCRFQPRDARLSSLMRPRR